MPEGLAPLKTQHNRNTHDLDSIDIILQKELERKLSSGFSWLKDNWPRPSNWSSSKAIYVSIIGSGDATKKHIRESAERWVKSVKSGRLDVEFCPLLNNWLADGKYKNLPGITFAKTDDIIKKENAWEHEKKQLNKAPRWAKKFSNENMKSENRMTHAARCHVNMNKNYLLALIKVGEKSDCLWEEFWKSMCFNNITPPEKSEESLNFFIKNC